MKWNEVPKVYQISVLNFFYTQNDKIINWYTMKNDDNQGPSESMNVIFIEIKKIIKKLQNKKITRELINSLTVIEKWCIFFLCKRDEKFAMLSELIVKSQEGIMEAERVLSRIEEEEINWHRQNAYYDRLSHEATIIYEATEKGMKQGIQQGAQEKAVENAKNFLKMKLGTVEQIAQGTGLSIEEVEKLASEIQ